MKNILILFFVAFSIFSCVPRKNLVYFQGTPEEKKDINRVANAPYRLQVEDFLSIDITSGNEDLEELVSLFQKAQVNNQAGGGQGGGQMAFFQGYRVDPHGNIRLPVLGEINVLGYTTTEVRKKLEIEIKKYFKDINDIFITVKLFGFRYVIFGEISSPGEKIILQNRVSIIDAIVNAGDIGNFGDRKNVEIIRNNETKTEKFHIDLTQINAFNSDLFYLKPNDMIYIKPLRQKIWGVGTTGLQALSTLVSIVTLLTSVIIISRNLTN